MLPFGACTHKSLSKARPPPTSITWADCVQPALWCGDVHISLELLKFCSFWAGPVQISLLSHGESPKCKNINNTTCVLALNVA